MDDEQLRHLVKLGSVTVDMVRNPDFTVDLIEMSPREARDTATCLRILADAFVELARRQDMLPTFRVPSRSVGEVA